MPMNLALTLGLSSRATASGGGGNVAPVITGVPTISGTAEVGNVLTASPASVTGTPSPTRTWQWIRDGVDISGETSITYTLVAADYGVTITVRQIETNVAGSDDATSAGTAIAAFDPADVFTTGVEGQWAAVDIADLWQDTARTTPVTATGQSVASWRVNTSSGVTYFEQATSANRPTYQENANGAGYLLFDGVNDSMATANQSAPSGATESTMMVAIDFDGTPLENDGFISFRLGASPLNGNRAIMMTSTGNLKVDAAANNAPTTYAIGTSFIVLEGRFGSSVDAAINGGSFVSSGVAVNTSVPSPLVIGRGILTNGESNHKFYGFVHVVKTITSDERSGLVGWLSALENP